MILSKIYNKLSEEQKEDFVFGLVLGLVWGLVFGLVFGLVWGLVWGLVFGLVGGLVGGLVVILFNLKEALPFLIGFYPILFLIVGIIIIFEIMFWLMPKEQLKEGTNLFWHTCKRKGENILELLLGLSVIAQVYILIREFNKYLNYELYQETIKWMGYVVAGIIVVGIIIGLCYLLIKSNELKYKK